MHRSRFTLLALLCTALVLLGVQSNGPRQGRQGNALYEEGQYLEAANAYSQGLRGYGDAIVDEDPVFSALQNNLGTALHRQRTYEDAHDAFEAALHSAPNTEEVTRAAYNAGNNAYRMGEKGAALEYYRRALMADPDNDDARHNYEFVKRQQEEGEDTIPGDTDDDDTPPDEQEGLHDENHQEPDAEEEPPAPPEDMVGGDDNGLSEDDLFPDDFDDTEMTPDQAIRILEALELDELELLRDAMRMNAPERQVEKDW